MNHCQFRTLDTKGKPGNTVCYSSLTIDYFMQSALWCGLCGSLHRIDWLKTVRIFTILGQDEKIHIIEPLDVIDFHDFMAHSYLILTDSGGIQEEAPALGKPVLVMRDTTERPEGIAAGTLRLVGTSEETIYQAVKQLLDNEAEYNIMSQSSNPYGDGFASQRIADILERSLLDDQSI